MAKLTLIEIVNSVLSSMKSNEVQDINDTHEATRVVKIAREVYEQEVAYGDWPHLDFVGNLTGLGDVTTPTVMRIPDAVEKIDLVRYELIDDNLKKSYPEITFIKDPQEFLDIVLTRTSTDADVEEVLVPSIDTINIFVYNDRNPTFCTSFDDEHLVFDAYDNTVSTTLTGGRSLVTGSRETAWSDDKAFVMDLPSDMFPYVLSRITVVANNRLAEKAAGVDKQSEQRGRSYIRQTGGKTDGKNRKPNYGRK